MQSLLYINVRCEHCFAGYNYFLSDTILKITALENLFFCSSPQESLPGSVPNKMIFQGTWEFIY